MSRVECESFCELAPVYIDYVLSSPKRPSSLAKILGAYSVVYKNGLKGNAGKLNFLVIENIAFGADQDWISFDLKGTRRKRNYIPLSTPQVHQMVGAVGLDDDFVEWSQTNPVFLDTMGQFCTSPLDVVA
ncbi:hypothetical protein ACOME3_008507 [Neoechinorhynchus agilis]